MDDEKITATVEMLKSWGGFVVVPRADYERVVRHMASDDEMPAGQVGELALYDTTAPDDYVFLGDNEDELWTRFATAWCEDDDLEDVVVDPEVMTKALDDTFARIRSGAIAEERKQAFFGEVEDFVKLGFLTPELASEVKRFEDLNDNRK